MWSKILNCYIFLTESSKRLIFRCVIIINWSNKKNISFDKFFQSAVVKKRKLKDEKRISDDQNDGRTFGNFIYKYFYTCNLGRPSYTLFLNRNSRLFHEFVITRFAKSLKILWKLSTSCAILFLFNNKFKKTQTQANWKALF